MWARTEWLRHRLERLIGTFTRDIDIAKTIDSPNPQDDLSVKAAMVGFCYNSSMNNWEYKHYQYVNQYLIGDYSLESLQVWGGNYINVQIFAALCVGYMLGLHDTHKATDHDLFLGGILIPELIAMNAKALCGHPPVNSADSVQDKTERTE